MEKRQKNIRDLTPEALQKLMAEMGQPSFRAKQLFGWLHQRQIQSFEEMSNIPAGLREQLAARWDTGVLAVSQKQVSADGTIKYLLRLPDDNHIEAVLMRYKHGNSLCISSQVGCRMGCRFCASAKTGLVRGLTPGEMAGEVYAAMRDSGEHISHIVLMGIGEPLDNLDNVLDFLHIITHPQGLNLSMRHISLSTSGLVPAIQKLGERRLGLTLSVSLHAADDKTRSGMMPVNDAYPIAELLSACRAYQQKTGRRVSFEYAMVHGVNDLPADAKKLAGLLKGMGAHVNLIPINPVDGSPYGASDEKNILAFQKQLQQLGVNVTIRRRLGSDISAACGQLRRQASKEC